MAKSFSVKVGDFVETYKGQIVDVVELNPSGTFDDGNLLTVSGSDGKTFIVPEARVKILCPVYSTMEK